jgi:taurine dioxygenase
VTLKIVPFAAALGAEIVCADVRELQADDAASISHALIEHMVVVLRRQQLSDPELITFGRRFGELDFAPYAHIAGAKARDFPEVIVISNVQENGQSIGVLGDAEVVWHSDNSYREDPLGFSMLHALELPHSGGETSFANMYAALETLPADIRARIDTLSIKHDMTYNSAGQLRSGFQPVTDVRTAPGPWHPIVRTHPHSGHNALYLGRRPNAYISGLPIEESEALLDRLWQHATQERFTCTHRWQVGDIVIWDNRCVMHHRTPFDSSARRVMHRVQCKGEKPMRAADSRAGAHPRSATA